MMQPKLRFLGFKEEWHGSSLSKVFNFKNGYNASAGEYGHGVLFINVLDIINNNFITSNDIVGKVNMSSEMLEKYSVKDGDILFQRSSETVEEVGQANVYLGEGIVSFGGFVIRGSKKTEDDSLFLNYLLKTSLVRRDIMKRAGGSTRYNIGQESLNEVMVYLPINIEEQVKIANFFSVVDQKITILEKQQQAWEQYKQGMMQKLFSGKLRFKDDNGEDFPDWECSSLEQIANVNPKTPKSEIPNSFYYIDLEAVSNGKLNQLCLMSKSDAPSRAQRVPISGDILFQCVRPYQQNNFYFVLEGNYVVSTGYALIRTKQNPKFIFYALHTKDFLDNVINKCIGTSYPAINATDLQNIKIQLPCIKEQQKIAGYLSSVDKKIDNISQQLTQMKNWKQGLFQQMFI